MAFGQNKKRPRWLVANLSAAVLLLAACGTASAGNATSVAVNDDEQPATEQVESTSTSTDDDSGGQTEQTQASGEADSSADGDDDQDGAAEIDDSIPDDFTQDAAHRLAPAADERRNGLVYWNPSLAGTIDDEGSWINLLDGPLASVAAIDDDRLVFQRESPESGDPISISGPDGERTLIELDDGDESLELEGAAPGADAVVYYQRRQVGGIEGRTTTLEAFDLAADSTTELLVTGGFESGTAYSLLTGDRGVGLWGGEAFTDIRVVDLTTGDIVHDQGGPQSECLDDPACPRYDAATILDGEIYGIRSIFNQDQGWVDAFGVFRYDVDTGTEELVVSYPWDNGLWYVEDLFAHGDELVLSLRNAPAYPPTGDAAPLPALFLDPTDPDGATTSPFAAYVRPIG